MERDVAIARSHQRVAIVRRQVPIDDTDVRTPACGVSNALELLMLPLAVDALDDQRRSFAWRERSGEGLDHREWVLPLHSAEEIEAEQEDESMRHAERFALGFRDHFRDVDRKGDYLDGL